MDKSTSSVGVVIGTYERPEELATTLRALSESTLLPRLVVVVDASESRKAKEANIFMCASFSKRLQVVYRSSSAKSLTVQRNAGVDILIQSDVEFIQVLDDDTAPAPDYLARLAGILSEEELTLGVSGVAPNYAARGSNLFLRALFVIAGLDSFREGAISRAGVGIPIRSGAGVVDSEWLIGCSMWKRKVFDEFRFNSLFLGSALFEDVEFSARVGKAGRLRVDTNARLDHSMSLINRPNETLHYYRFSRNRWLVLQALGLSWRRKFEMLNSALFMFVVLLGKAAFSPRDWRTFMASALSTLAGYRDGLFAKDPK